MTSNNDQSYIYLDNAASTPIYKEVIDEMLPFMFENYGNPSSLHKFGRKARQGLLNSRLKIANSIGANLHEILFTSGGTESNNLALTGTSKLINKIDPTYNHIIVSEIEHDSILETVKDIEEQQKFKVSLVPVDNRGIINEKKFTEMISPKTSLISIMMVNNEIGTIQPIKNLIQIAKNKNKNIIFHTDAVQAYGKILINVKDLGVDLLSISSHKINGPKGVGALYIKKGTNIKPVLFGGGQEKKLRSGTENVQSIIGFGKACEIFQQNFEIDQKCIKKIQLYTIDTIIKEIPFCRLNGSDKYRISNNINISFSGINGEDLLIKLDENGIGSSTGSACSSNKKQKASHVLKAIGLSHDEITGSIRFSIGHQNTIEEIKTMIIKLKEIISELRKIGDFDNRVTT